MQRIERGLKEGHERGPSPGTHTVKKGYIQLGLYILDIQKTTERIVIIRSQSNNSLHSEAYQVKGRAQWTTDIRSNVPELQLLDGQSRRREE